MYKAQGPRLYSLLIWFILVKTPFCKKNSQTNPNKLGWKGVNAHWIDMPSPPSKILPKIQLQFGEFFQHSCRLTKLAIPFWCKYVSQISIRYVAEQFVSVCQGFLYQFSGVIIRHSKQRLVKLFSPWTHCLYSG